METNIKILDTHKFEVEMYHQTIEVCSVDSENFGWQAQVECPENPREKIRVLFDLSKIDRGCVVHESVHVAFFIVKRTLMCCEPDNNEHFAYLVEFVSNHLFRITDKMQQKLNTVAK